jgi:Na+-driven multidrug efflux pump
MFFWGFGSLSDADNALWIMLITAFFIVTLPGSLILFLIGFSAAFLGKPGEVIAAGCIFLSVANAHMMGMFYFGWLFERYLKKEHSIGP